jgi:hypothetical protein
MESSSISSSVLLSSSLAPSSSELPESSIDSSYPGVSASDVLPTPSRVQVSVESVYATSSITVQELTISEYSVEESSTKPLTSPILEESVSMQALVSESWKSSVVHAPIPTASLADLSSMPVHSGVSFANVSSVNAGVVADSVQTQLSPSYDSSVQSSGELASDRHLISDWISSSDTSQMFEYSTPELPASSEIISSLSSASETFGATLLLSSFPSTLTLSSSGYSSSIQEASTAMGPNLLIYTSAPQSVVEETFSKSMMI